MSTSLPLFLAGPIIRRSTQHELCVWAVTSAPLDAEFALYSPDSEHTIFRASFKAHKQVQLGQQCYIVLAQFSRDSETEAETPDKNSPKSAGFPIDTPLQYDILTDQGSLLTDIDGLLYSDEKRPTFVISTRAENIAHGSCRHPHHRCDDALVALDTKYNAITVQDRADLLIMGGDQIYADDVCGPMMYAIREAIDILGLRDQALDDDTITHCSQLVPDIMPLYGRTERLPYTTVNHGLIKRLLKSAPEPVFSSNTTENHLISFNEFIAMYILVWSPSLWSHIPLPDADAMQGLSDEHKLRWTREKQELSQFCSGLKNVRRLFAHIPTYMIFDDHDVTDDFNLTVGWERAVYESPLAQNILTNAMLGYFFCQGWGNNPNAFDSGFWHTITQFAAEPTPRSLNEVNQLILHFEHWHYTLPTTPKVVVLDTRTRRWRSESSSNKPSGLMDWESLMDFQQNVINADAVVVVSPAPMFGVKFIETLQRIVTFCGHPLATDSENWMAHPGSANALLNIFKHPKTPKNFVILSGDVHYSFAYDIRIRFRKGSPRIWQITCSGFRNQFPEPYLSVFEWFDRKLFWPESPLNIFTRRKRMRIERRRPDNGSPQLLVNASAVGEVLLYPDGSPATIGLLTGAGEQIVFNPCEEVEAPTESYVSRSDSVTRD
ncbi:alkaline phosphatase family protein [Enterovibrio sp. ZSDZ42]|uniref:Alkaline phosphatase family protein n=1 Tax=Enterovibrio gelatinilyticus TaxID=2899819 RepID=A0ABT5R2H4_9GAMM|nr:alkaline phosphatase family protein [Enterovibrio sp. ZSDZ42]MDD1793707.1 alkaline phosphatase family protein [Enterovibrio sp. ZSDZ42]